MVILKSGAIEDQDGLDIIWEKKEHEVVTKVRDLKIANALAKSDGSIN